MNCLSPSILSADFGNLANQLKIIDEAGAEYVHYDVMDGIFVPVISYGLPVLKSIRKYTNRKFDVHLMVMEPERFIEDFAVAGADIITVHYEACRDIKKTIAAINACGVKAAVAINPATPVSKLKDVLSEVDMVLIMTVNPGFGGQKLIPEALGKVKELKQLLKEQKLDIDIEVDGGICDETIDAAIEAGANVIVAGSAIFKGDIAHNVTKFLEKLK